MIKSMMKSMTLQFNALALALFAVDVMLGLNVVKDNPDYTAMFMAISNILLRFKTKKAVV